MSSAMVDAGFDQETAKPDIDPGRGADPACLHDADVAALMSGAARRLRAASRDLRARSDYPADHRADAPAGLPVLGERSIRGGDPNRPAHAADHGGRCSTSSPTQGLKLRSPLWALAMEKAASR